MNRTTSHSTLMAGLLCATALVPVVAHAEPAGFSIKVNGATVAGDNRAPAPVRRADAALAQAEVQVVFDGLRATPELGLAVAPSGAWTTVTSVMTYPAFVTRGELRLLDERGRLVAVHDLPANGQVTVPGDGLWAVHRVYDAAGRFDETAPLPLTRAQAPEDATALRRIRVAGGAVTVSGASVAPGARVTVLGEPARAESGGFRITRILPPGDHPVRVTVSGPGGVNVTRDIHVPASEWFRTGIVDLTYGTRTDGMSGQTQTFTNGRLAVYADGHTAGGVQITAQADTGDGPLKDVFRRLEEKDPRAYALRVDPKDLYPTYGDDSTRVDATPTSGRVYLRVQKDNDHLLWGDFRAGIDGGLLRNDRTLYGAQAHVETAALTDAGAPRAQLTVYAAQPDRLPQRDVFVSTGGAVYFLDRQDISQGSDTLALQLRDPDTGRVIDTVTLERGTDYDINYIQGIVTLSRPIGQLARGTGVLATLGRAPDVRLVAQYEYTPVTGDVDGLSYGGRAEAWVTDQLRVGVTAMVEQTGIADQRAFGADVLWQHSAETYALAEVAQTKGPGFGYTLSEDGGLVVDTIALASGTGRAAKAELSLGFADLGLSRDGRLRVYGEQRTEGLSTPDHQVTASTGDETLWGLSLEADLSDRVGLALAFDAYDNAVGKRDRSGDVALTYQVSDQWTVDLGAEHSDQSDRGRRTDLAAQLTYHPSDALSVYGFVQGTVDRQGRDRNDRAGIGATLKRGDWDLSGELSGGSLGPGGFVTASRDDGQGGTAYLGYELEPERTLTGVTLTGRDRGRFIAGGTRVVNDSVSVFGENRYDLFGRHRSLTSAYGVTYAPTKALTTTVAFDYGTTDDGEDTGLDRYALTIGARWQTEAVALSGRLEYRLEEGTRGGALIDSRTWAARFDGRWTLDESRRIVASLDAATTKTDQSSLLNGDYADLVLGYAYRPVDNDRLNVLARYRMLHDMYGQRTDGTDEDRIRQRSHVVSIDASYDLSDRWTLGGKFGLRLSDTATGDGASFAANDAWLGVVSGRYHMLHNWDGLLELRHFNAKQAGFSETAVLGAVYRHVGANAKLGVGYNFGRFSDDLTDMTHDDRGAFINLVAKF